MITFFNAGAGSGKTYQLSEELSKFLLEKGGKPSQVILTTFTVKSAEELKERVRNRMHQENKAGVAAEMSAALIGTINSVCSHLVEKYALEQGLSPDLRVMDENAANGFFSEFIAASISTQSFERLNFLCSRFSIYENASEGSNSKDDLKPGWPRMVKALGEKLRAYNFNAENMVSSKQAALGYISDFLLTDSNVTLASLLESINQHQDSFPIPVESVPFSDKDTVEALNTLSALLKSGREYRIKWEQFAKAGTKLTRTTELKSPWIKNLMLDCRNYHRSPEFLAEYQELTELVYEVSFAMIESYQQYKQQRGLIDFSDQELLLLDMLENSEIVRREIACTFKLIMVDEFQDSSPVQLAVFSKLSTIIENAVWVGDPKQSIYGFRDSDASLFNASLKAVAAQTDNKIEALKISYRSRPPLVQAANEVFCGIFNGIMPAHNIRLSPCTESMEREPDYADPAIAVQFYEDPTIDNYLSSIAKKVVETLKSNKQVYDRKSKSYRTIRGGDVALLFRSNTIIEKATKALKAQGMEVSCHAEGLQNQAEVLWISSLLRLLINPGDELAIANIMLLEKSVDGVETLIRERLHYLNAGGKLMTWSDYSPVVNLVITERDLLTHMPLASSISYLVTLSDLSMYMARWGNEQQRMANIQKVVEQAASYEQQSMIASVAATFSGFLEHLDSCTQLPPSGGENAVTVMTVHKAKGLEWPMVVLAKLDMYKCDLRILFNQVHVLQPENLELQSLLHGQKIIYLPWPFAGKDKVREELQASRDTLDFKLGASKKCCLEEDRLLYVAVTRAKEYLVLPYFKNSSGAYIESPDRTNPTRLFSNNHFQELKRVAAPVPKEHVLSGIMVTVETVSKYEEKPAEASNKNEEVIYYNMGEKKQGLVHAKRFIAPSAAKKIATGVRLRVENYNSAYVSLDNVPVHLQATLGQMVHHGFASWQPGSQKQVRITRLKELIDRMQLIGYIEPQELDQSFEAFWKYIISYYKILSIYKEMPLIEVAPQNGTITSGIADLVFETDKGLVLIDHKTFPGHFEDMVLNPNHDQYAGRYASQLNDYKQMLEKATGKPVIAMLLHYVIQGKLVEVKINQGVKTKQEESPASSLQMKLWEE